MAIPSQQIGWSQRAKLLWQISKQLENLIKVAGNVQLPTTTTTSTTVAPTTTTTTTTSALFSGTVVIGYGDNCQADVGSYAVTGNGTTFCNSTELTSAGFESIFQDVYVASYDGQKYLIYINGTVGVPQQLPLVCSTCTT